VCVDVNEGSRSGPLNATDINIENSFDVQLTCIVINSYNKTN